jgi:hypothetical protein
MEGEIPTTEYIVCFHWITDVKTGTALTQCVKKIIKVINYI